MNYIGNCTHLPARHVIEMADRAKETSYNALIKQVGTDQLKSLFPHYAWGQGQGLKLKDDYCVRYYRSQYQKRKCYFVVHSAIEYIFC
jgi:hypothetical protein